MSGGETDAVQAVDPYDVASGVLAGTIVVFLQVWIWSLVGGLVWVPPGTEPPVAEMAVFLALGVVLPAGGVALVSEDGPGAGIAAGGGVLIGIPIVDLAFATPPWQVPGLAFAAAVLAIVAVLGRRRATTPERAIGNREFQRKRG